MRTTTITEGIEAARAPTFTPAQSAEVPARVGNRSWEPPFSGEESLSARVPQRPPRSPCKELHGQPLSGLEKQVLRLIAVGQTYSAVAIELGLTRKAVDRHAERIHRKIGAHCVAHLVHYALARGEINLLSRPEWNCFGRS